MFRRIFARRNTEVRNLNIVRALLIIILSSLFIELCVFNFTFWESLSFKNYQVLNVADTHGLTENKNGSFTVNTAESAYIDFVVGGMHIDNVRIDMQVPGWVPNSLQDSLGPFISCSFEADDASSANMLRLPQFEWSGGISDSHVKRIHLSGKTDTLRLNINEQEGFTFSLGVAEMNVVRPFNFILVRFVFTAALISFFMLFRPSSVLYRRKLQRGSRLSLVAVAAVVSFEVVAILAVSNVAGVTDSPETVNVPEGDIAVLDFNQYNYLADSLLAGKLSLDLPVAPALQTMDNPYDQSQREAVLADAGEQYYVDYAYYKGAYYSYFGVLPAITLFAPFKILTGCDLRTDQAVSLLSVIYVLSANMLLLSGIKRLNRTQSIGLFSLASLSFVFSSGLLYLAYLPQLYSVPILMGLSCAFVGLCCWLRASREGSGGYSKTLLLVGGVFIAFTIACRPQYVLISLLAFPIFWNGIIKERAFFSRKGIVNTLLVVLPFILIAAPVMMYNQARFDSPFDFGAAYNLTGSDMTSRGIVLSRSLPAIFQYLFQPLSISAHYPYIFGIDMSVNYQGFWFYEPYLGGLIAFAPILLMLYRLPNWLKSRSIPLRMFALVALCIAAIILFADFQIASITMRYFSDFAWLALIVCWLVVATEPTDSNDALTRPSGLVIVLATMGLVIGFWSLLSPDRYAALIWSCPSVYYGVQNALCLA